jgi:hypothetical protein
LTQLAIDQEKRNRAVSELIGSPNLSFGGLNSRPSLASPQPVAPQPGPQQPTPQAPQTPPGAGPATGPLGADLAWQQQPQTSERPMQWQTPSESGATIPQQRPTLPTGSEEDAVNRRMDANAPQPAAEGDPAAKMAEVVGNPQAQPQQVASAVSDHMRSFPDPLDMLDKLRDAIRRARPDADPAVVGDATMKLYGLVNTGNLSAMRLYAQLANMDTRREIATGNVGGQPTVAEKSRVDRKDTAATRTAQAGQRLDLAREKLIDAKAERLLKSADKGLAQSARAIMAQRRTVLDRAKASAGIPTPEDSAQLETLDKQIEDLESQRAKALGVTRPQPVGQ